MPLRDISALLIGELNGSIRVEHRRRDVPCNTELDSPALQPFLEM